VKIADISPSPSDDEAAAIAIALARVFAASASRVRESERWRARRENTRASLEYYVGKYDVRTPWDETARREALDAGV
jgi:hypothetical protein